MEAVLSSRLKYKKVYYIIRWKSDWENLEKPAENVQNATDKIVKYHAKYLDRPGPHNLKELLRSKKA